MASLGLLLLVAAVVHLCTAGNVMPQSTNYTLNFDSFWLSNCFALLRAQLVETSFCDTSALVTVLGFISDYCKGIHLNEESQPSFIIVRLIARKLDILDIISYIDNILVYLLCSFLSKKMMMDPCEHEQTWSVSLQNFSINLWYCIRSIRILLHLLSLPWLFSSESSSRMQEGPMLIWHLIDSVNGHSSLLARHLSAPLLWVICI